jgi:hypothetical protein
MSNRCRLLDRDSNKFKIKTLQKFKNRGRRAVRDRHRLMEPAVVALECFRKSALKILGQHINSYSRVIHMGKIKV